jgi:hypothetical protein
MTVWAYRAQFNCRKCSGHLCSGHFGGIRALKLSEIEEIIEEVS